MNGIIVDNSLKCEIEEDGSVLKSLTMGCLAKKRNPDRWGFRLVLHPGVNQASLMGHLEGLASQKEISQLVGCKDLVEFRIKGMGDIQAVAFVLEELFSCEAIQGILASQNLFMIF